MRVKSGARARKGLRHQEGPAAVSLGGDEDGGRLDLGFWVENQCIKAKGITGNPCVLT